MEPIPEKEITIFDYLYPLIKYRRFIIWFWLIAVILSVIISFILPKIYTATATIMPPSTSGDSASLLGSLGLGGNLGGLASMVLGMPSSADLYVDMLNSRVIADTLITRFDLKQVYHKKYHEDTLKALANRTEIQKTKGEMVAVTVEDKDPNRAAAIANAYVDELDKLTRQLGMSSAGRMRVFLEKRINETKRELQTAEDNLKEFQTNHKMIALDEQTKAMVEGAAQLEGQLIAAETELGILRSFATAANPRVKLVQTKIAELKKQLGLLAGSSAHATNESGAKRGFARPSSDSFSIPLSQVPDLGLEFVRLLREVKIQETVFELLTQQYELARVNEAKDTQTIQVVDIAKIPDKKTKPKRSLIVLITIVLAFTVAVFISFIRNYLDNLDIKNKQKWEKLIGELRRKQPIS